jgi:hypothetical protein
MAADGPWTGGKEDGERTQPDFDPGQRRSCDPSRRLKSRVVADDEEIRYDTVRDRRRVIRKGELWNEQPQKEVSKLLDVPSYNLGVTADR